MKTTSLARITRNGMITAAAVILGTPAKLSAGPPFKEAKLNIEHNATDHDTGFQGAFDSDGWRSVNVTGPEGVVLTIKGKGKLGVLGLTELFFETVEPANADVPIDQMLRMLPAGNYVISGPAISNGERDGTTTGTATLTHVIPAGPVLLAPAADAVVPAGSLAVDWAPVTTTLTGGPVTIIAYQLIIEKDVLPHPDMIGKFGLSVYLPPSVTNFTVSPGFLEPGANYKWEVLAIETSGNQTLSSSQFITAD